MAYDVRTLREAGIEFADAFVAVTNKDNANVMAVQVARSVFGVRRTIARLDDPHRADAYRALNIRYVAASQLVSRVVHEQLVEEEFDYHLTFAGGDVEIVEMVLGADVVGLTVADIQIRNGLRVAAVRRGDKTVIPSETFALLPNDLLVASARHGVRKQIKRFLIDVEPELA
jgi:trk system potassium uptake protein TrkA